MNVELIAFTCVGDDGDTPAPDQVCNLAARVCVSDKMPEMEYVDDTYHFWTDEDCKALKHAIQSGHESVAEHASFTFAVSGVSRALTHQLVRHRVASYSQQSQRYVKVKLDELCYILPLSIKKAIHTELMNGGGWSPNGCLEESLNEYKTVLRECVERMRKLGVPEEDIRYLYPQGITTNIIVTMNARELRHFFTLRCCNRAQWEIKELANKMLELVKDVAPIIFENAGPSCVQLGYCPEKKSCGRVKE